MLVDRMMMLVDWIMMTLIEWRVDVDVDSDADVTDSSDKTYVHVRTVIKNIW